MCGAPREQVPDFRSPEWLSWSESSSTFLLAESGVAFKKKIGEHLGALGQDSQTRVTRGGRYRKKSDSSGE